LPEDTKLRSSKYLNSVIEQNHRGVNLRLSPMHGLKRTRTAAITIAGIELLRRIHKGQFNLGKLCIKDGTARPLQRSVGSVVEEVLLGPCDDQA
jgi:transposase-like protein